jgi:Uma2 family endonuclease
MATTAAFVPVEVYLASSFEPDADYVDGVIEERPVGENDHSAWQKALVFWFERQAREWQIRVRPELRVQVAETKYRIPDVTLLDRNQPQEPIATHPPVAVFEILSPKDTLRGVMTRCADYERMGIKTILVIDPEGPAYRYAHGRIEPLEARAFDIPGSACRFDLDEIAKLID